MSATSRTKGKAGEREIAALIRDLTGWDARRRVRQHDGDSDLLGVPGWSIEVKRHARALRSDIAAWWQQTVEQAGIGERPALFFRANHDAWRAVWSLGIHLSTDWREYAMTCEGSVEAWAAVARDMTVDALSVPRTHTRDGAPDAPVTSSMVTTSVTAKSDPIGSRR